MLQARPRPRSRTRLHIGFPKGRPRLHPNGAPLVRYITIIDLGQFPHHRHHVTHHADWGGGANEHTLHSKVEPPRHLPKAFYIVAIASDEENKLKRILHHSFALTAYSLLLTAHMLTCSHAYCLQLTCFALTCLQLTAYANASRLQLTAYMLTCLHAFMLSCFNITLTPLYHSISIASSPL